MATKHAFNKTGQNPGTHARFLHLHHRLLQSAVPGDSYILHIAVIRVQISRVISISAIVRQHHRST